MKKKMISVFALSAVSAGALSAAEPIVSNVKAVQGLGSRNVTVSYTLSNEPAVITVDVQTNRGDDVWVSIGAERQMNITGDMNKLVQPGSRAIVWKARNDWPDQLITGGNIRFAVSAWTTNAPPDYMVVDLNAATPAESVTYYASTNFIPGGVADVRYKTTHILMRKIPAAGVKWKMGSPEDESGRMTDWNGALWEKQHDVILSDDYYMAVFETTQKQFSKFNPWHRSHPNNSQSIDGLTASPIYDTYPLNRMYYTNFRGTDKGLGWPENHDVDDSSYIGMLRAATGLEFDLPTEAQWEFACRAGTTSAYCCGFESTGKPNEHIYSIEGIGEYAVFTYNKVGTMSPVGQKKPNNFGLYDMMGNVREMCLDWKGDYPADGGTYVDPRGAKKPVSLNLDADSVVIIRGGFYNSIADHLRSAARATCKVNNWDDSVGFRLVCPAVAK